MPATLEDLCNYLSVPTLSGDPEVEDTVTNAAVDYLRARGYRVEIPLLNREITVADLSHLVGMRVNSVSRCLARRDCPPFASVRGDSGRIRRLRPSTELVEWLLSRRRSNSTTPPLQNSITPWLP